MISGVVSVLVPLCSSCEKLWTIGKVVLLWLQDLETNEIHKIHAFGSVSYSFIVYFTCILGKIVFASHFSLRKHSNVTFTSAWGDLLNPCPVRPNSHNLKWKQVYLSNFNFLKKHFLNNRWNELRRSWIFLNFIFIFFGAHRPVAGFSHPVGGTWLDFSILGWSWRTGSWIIFFLISLTLKLSQNAQINFKYLLSSCTSAKLRDNREAYQLAGMNNSVGPVLIKTHRRRNHPILAWQSHYLE